MKNEIDPQKLVSQIVQQFPEGVPTFEAVVDLAKLGTPDWKPLTVKDSEWRKENERLQQNQYGLHHR